MKLTIQFSPEILQRVYLMDEFGFHCFKNLVCGHNSQYPPTQGV